MALVEAADGDAPTDHGRASTTPDVRRPDG